MSSTLGAALALSGALAFFASASAAAPGPLWPTAGETQGPKSLQTAPPSPEAQALLASIRGYQAWPRFTELQKPKLSRAHDKLWVLVFHNDVVTGAIARKQLPLPDGSILVKENRFTPDGPVVLLTVMAKQHGRWFWLEATPEGRVVQADGTPISGTTVKACASCHEQNVDNDAVFTHDFAGD